jgi:hypothetical protein
MQSGNTFSVKNPLAIRVRQPTSTQQNSYNPMNERSAEYFYGDRVFQMHDDPFENIMETTPITGFQVDDRDTASVSSRRSALKPSSQRWSGSCHISSSRSVVSTKSEVSFDSVGIREFPVTLGDNPTAVGPPVQLDYSTTKHTKTINLDHYERERKRKPRRNMRELRMTTRQRHVILREERNLPQEEINKAVWHAKVVRLQRLQTKSQSWFEQQWDEATESAHRKFSRCMSCPC